MQIFEIKYSNSKIDVRFLSLSIFKIKEQDEYMKIYLLGIQILKLYKFSYVNHINEINAKIINSNKIIYINKNTNSKSRILHYGTWNQQCGIATFLSDYISGLNEAEYNYNAIVPVIGEYNINIKTAKTYLDKIIEYSKDFDLVSIQHEYSFWILFEYRKYQNLLNDNFYKKFKLKNSACSLPLLDYFISNLLKQQKRVSIIWHTDFKVALEDFFSCNKSVDYKQLPFFRFIDNPLLDITIMNDKFLLPLNKYNIPTSNIKFIDLPVTNNDIYISKTKEELLIANKLPSDCILLGTLGFINRHKGIEDVIECMRYLPEKYKYIHIGGVHPNDTSGYINELYDKIKKYNLESRVKITGYLSDQDLINYLNIIDIGLYIGKAPVEFASGAINQFIVNEIPTITTNIANFKKIHERWKCIKLLENDTCYCEISKTIINLSENEEAKTYLGKNCERFCKENTFAKFAIKCLEDNHAK